MQRGLDYNFVYIQLGMEFLNNCYGTSENFATLFKVGAFYSVANMYKEKHNYSAETEEFFCNLSEWSHHLECGFKLYFETRAW